MRLLGRLIVVVGVLVGLGGCGNQQQQSQRPQQDPDAQTTQAGTFEKVRGPAVAGMFYPRSKEKLTKDVDELLAEAKPQQIKDLRGLICPHAGYEYSGKTAAIGYKQLEGRKFRTVILLGPTHYAFFQGASIPDADAYETPLGMIPVSPKAAELGKLKPFSVNPSCDVTRPGWWRQAPKELPPFGEDTPHSWEHSLEVQLPFLQRTLKDFSIVPIVFGQVDAAAAAGVLVKFIDQQTLLVVSSDLSHYRSYETARALDTTCCKAICDLNVEWTQQQEACGKGPILTLIHIARQKGWKAKLLDCRSSGDTTEEKSRVVGYAAIAFYAPGEAARVAAVEKPPSQTGQQRFPPSERKFLLALARKSVTAAVTGRAPPAPESDKLPKKFTEPAAVFVTLKKGHRLRGCIGGTFPREPLYRAVIGRARSAAVEDRRFPPVRSDELAEIEIEVSVLSLPRPLQFNSPEQLLEKLRPGIDGVVLRVGQKNATYLPQVWEQLPNKRMFLNHLAEKAELSPAAWMSTEAKVLVYQVEAFKESEM